MNIDCTTQQRLTTLHLVLKKKWFDMIATGEKKEEYREITDYWRNRLTTGVTKAGADFREYVTVIFQHGYANNAPRVILECKGIRVSEGRPQWGANPGVSYFTISLGNIITPMDYIKANPQLKLSDIAKMQQHYDYPIVAFPAYSDNTLLP